MNSEILPSTPVLIPGYNEIMDMMLEYEGVNENEFKSGIKNKDIKMLTDCSKSINPETDKEKIIVLRKQDTKIFGFTLKNESIECDSEKYYAFASHNFKIFIQDILQWNPFLNSPSPKQKNEENSRWQGNSPHTYSGESKFKDENWWNEQNWWKIYKNTNSFKTLAESAPAPVHQIPPPVKTIEPQIERLSSMINLLKKQQTSLIDEINKLLKIEQLSKEQRANLNTLLDSIKQPPTPPTPPTLS